MKLATDAMSAGSRRASALELHRERAKRLRTALLQRLFDLKLQAAEDERSPAIVRLEARIIRLEAILRLDRELELCAEAFAALEPRRRAERRMFHRRITRVSKLADGSNEVHYSCGHGAVWVRHPRTRAVVCLDCVTAFYAGRCRQLGG